VLFFNLTVVIAHKRDWAVFALVLPFPPGIFWNPFWKKNEFPERNFSFQNGNLSVSVCHGAEEAEAQEPRTLSGVEDLNGGNQGAALGGGRLSRRRHSCAGAAPWDRVAVLPPQARARTRACDS